MASSQSPLDEKKSSIEEIDYSLPAQPKGATHVVAKPKDSRLAEAALQEQLNFRSWRMLKLWAILFVSYMCSAQNGFDSNTVRPASLTAA
jgi:hypothetical protein